jgi:hypothetical protein
MTDLGAPYEDVEFGKKRRKEIRKKGSSEDPPRQTAKLF